MQSCSFMFCVQVHLFMKYVTDNSLGTSMEDSKVRGPGFTCVTDIPFSDVFGHLVN